MRVMLGSAKNVGSSYDSQMRRRLLAGILWLGSVSIGLAQPNPRQMSGLPLPDPQLPDGTITVRIIRGQLSNNVPDHPVELHEGDSVVTANTDANGRASFLTLNPGAEVQAVTELDGDRLQSRPFPVPARGGIRVMLVGRAATDSLEPARSGRVTLGGESRIVVELGEENVSVFYLFDVINAGDVPVKPSEPIVLDIPSGAQTTTVLSDSSPNTTSDGPHVMLPGPFPPGSTPIRVAYVLPYSGGSLVISQTLPADLKDLLVIAEKWGSMDIASEQITRRGEMTPDGVHETTYLLASGPRLSAGETLTFELTGLPHHSRLPSTIALILACVILGAGVWDTVVSGETDAKTERRQRLEARTEKLFADLVKIENQQRTGKIGTTKYATRHLELFTALERVYRERDEELAPVVLSSVRSMPKRSPATGQSGTTG